MNFVISARMGKTAARWVTLFGAAVVSLSAHATLTVSTTADSPAAGAHYVNFNDLTYSNGASGGLSVTFTPNSGLNIGAPPYLSNGNGLPFGDATGSGPDTTQFLFAGTPLTLGMPGPETYFGILWGSVDARNSLSFYAADGALVGVITGSDVAPNAHGSWDADGTVYVDVESSVAFTKVVADGGDSIFEFDNVAYSPSLPSVPEPAPAMLLLAGLLVFPLLARKRSSR